MVKLADALGRHIVVEVERHGHGIDGLAGLSAAQGRAFPCLVGGFPALLLEVAEDAAREAVFAAVVHDAALIRMHIFLGQELLLDAGGDMLPGQHFIEWARAARIPVHIQAEVGKGLLPRLEVEILAPAFELGPQLPGALDHVAHAPVAAG